MRAKFSNRLTVDGRRPREVELAAKRTMGRLSNLLPDTSPYGEELVEHAIR